MGVIGICPSNKKSKKRENVFLRNKKKIKYASLYPKQVHKPIYDVTFGDEETFNYQPDI